MLFPVQATRTGGFKRGEIMIKNSRLWALLFALMLIAASCGSDAADVDAGGEAEESAESTDESTDEGGEEAASVRPQSSPPARIPTPFSSVSISSRARLSRTSLA